MPAAFAPGPFRDAPLKLTYSRPRLVARATAVAAVAFTVEFATAGCSGSSSSNVHVAVPTPLASEAALCARLMPALPSTLDTGVTAIPATPVSPLVRAWGKRSDPVVVRCGVTLPKDYHLDSQLTTVDYGSGPVGWFLVTHGQRATLTSVRRPVKIEIRLPKRYRVDVVLAAISSVVAKLVPLGADRAE